MQSFANKDKDKNKNKIMFFSILDWLGILFLFLFFKLEHSLYNTHNSKCSIFFFIILFKIIYTTH